MPPTNKLKNARGFIKDLALAFPEIRNEVFDPDYKGSITLQLGCFKRFTQKAIDNNDLASVKRCFLFVESNIDKVENKVANALYITYLGNLKIAENDEAEKLLPTIFKRALNDLNEYYTLPSKNEKLNKFLDEL